MHEESGAAVTATTFEPEIEPLDGRCVHKAHIRGGGRRLRYAEVVTLWQESASFTAAFVSLLAEHEFPVFRWETPPVSRATQDQTFEFVIVASPELDVPADPSAFASHFKLAAGADEVVGFANLSNDAWLLAPTPREPMSAYAHLGAFTRAAPVEQNHALWRMVGRALEQRLDDRPVWLNTAGGGVPWLHVRLDSRPKYYVFDAYRSAALFSDY